MKRTLSNEMPLRVKSGIKPLKNPVRDLLEPAHNECKIYTPRLLAGFACRLHALGIWNKTDKPFVLECVYR